MEVLDASNSSSVAAVMEVPGRATVVGGATLLGEYVLTCAHVLDAGTYPRPGGQSVEVHLRRADGSPVTARVVKRLSYGNADSQDLALLKVTDGTHEVPLLCVQVSDRKEDDLEVPGFPTGPASPVSQGVQIGPQVRNGLRILLQEGGKQLWENGSGGAGVFGVAGARRYLCGLMLPPLGRLPARMIPIAQVLNEFAADMRPLAPELYPRVIVRFPHSLDTLDDIRAARKRRGAETFTLCLQSFSDQDELNAILSDAPASASRQSPEELMCSSDMRPLYLMAEGGAGKTGFVYDCIEQGISRGIIPFYLDVKSVADVDRPEPLKGAANEDGVRELFDRLGVSCTYDDFQQFVGREGTRGLLVVDGLNETAIDVSAVLRVLEYIIRQRHAKLLVIGVDRVAVGRVVPPFFKRQATLRHLERTTVDEIVRRQMGEGSVPAALWPLLGNPFFLDLYVRLKEPTAITRPALFAGYFRHLLAPPGAVASDPAPGSSLGLPATAVSLAQLAYNVYARGRLVFRRDELVDLGQGLAEKLLDSGLMATRAGGRGLVFRHQLLHDFLAGWHLAQHPESWGSASFDALTLNAKSADAVVLATECLEEGADRFISEVYDWNWQTAVSCIDSLLRGQKQRTSRVSDLLIDALLAIIAIKRFDRFRHTRSRTRAMSTVFSLSPSGIAFNTHTSEQALQGQIAADYGKGAGDLPADYQRWKALFLYDGKADPSDWSVLTDSPLIGWTAANVYKRRMCSQEAVTQLKEQYQTLFTDKPLDSKARTHRWRIVHVLGHAHKDAVAFLVTVAGKIDEGNWVRFGAVRSLAELASRGSPEDGREVLNRLAQLTPNLCAIGGGPQELRKLARLSEDCPQSVWWPGAFAQVLRAGLQEAKRQSDTAEAERWESLIDETGAGGG
jgi:hypothetical protein